MPFNIVWSQRIIEAVEWVEYYRKRLETAELEVGELKNRLQALERLQHLPVDTVPKKGRGRPRKVINAPDAPNSQ